MARIPEAEIERLKSEIAVERLVEAAGIALKKSGKDFIGKCPFHEDATASLIVTPAKNLWHCFGCGAAGGPLDWVMKKNGVSFRHAVELLREGVTGLPSLAVDAGGVKRSSVRALPAPVAFDADDQALLNQVIGYYHVYLGQVGEKAAGVTLPKISAGIPGGGTRIPDITNRATSTITEVKNVTAIGSRDASQIGDLARYGSSLPSPMNVVSNPLRHRHEPYRWST